MIERIIRACFGRPFLALLLVGAAVAVGAMAFQGLERDVFPDLSAPVFNVIVQNPAMGAEELETGIAIPLEAAMAGLPEVRRIRSASQLGVAQVTIEFEPEADYYRARQLVAERSKRSVCGIREQCEHRTRAACRAQQDREQVLRDGRPRLLSRHGRPDWPARRSGMRIAKAD